MHGPYKKQWKKIEMIIIGMTVLIILIKLKKHIQEPTTQIGKFNIQK